MKPLWFLGAMVTGYAAGSWACQQSYAWAGAFAVLAVVNLIELGKCE